MRLALVDAARVAHPLRDGMRLGAEEAADIRVEGGADHHATIRVRGEETFIEPVGPVSVGGLPVRAGALRLLHDGDHVVLGEIGLECTRIDTELPPNLDTVEIALRAGDRALQRLRWAVAVVEGEPRGAAISLETGRVYRIGRGDDADLRLDDPTASRVHLELKLEGGQLLLRDPGKTTGVVVGDGRLDAGRWAAWPLGLHVGLGRSALACRPPTDQSEAIAREVKRLAPVEEPVEAAAPAPEPPKVDPPAAPPIKATPTVPREPRRPSAWLVPAGITAVVLVLFALLYWILS